MPKSTRQRWRPPTITDTDADSNAELHATVAHGTVAHGTDANVAYVTDDDTDIVAYITDANADNVVYVTDDSFNTVAHGNGANADNVAHVADAANADNVDYVTDDSDGTVAHGTIDDAAANVAHAVTDNTLPDMFNAISDVTLANIADCIAQSPTLATPLPTPPAFSSYTLGDTTAVAFMISDLLPTSPAKPCPARQTRIQLPLLGKRQNDCMTQSGYAPRGRAPRGACQVGRRRTALGYQIIIYTILPSLEPRRWGIRRPTQGPHSTRAFGVTLQIQVFR
jgi:hypothetical protein